MLQGVPPERQREALRREAQRLTDVSAHHDGEIQARRAEGYRNEDPKIQGWLHLIRGTDAELQQNRGKVRTGTLNDRVQRIQAALGEPLLLMPRRVTPSLPPRAQPAKPSPNPPTRSAPPGAPEGEVSVGPTGYLASMLREGPTVRQEELVARGPMPAAQRTSNPRAVQFSVAGKLRGPLGGPGIKSAGAVQSTSVSDQRSRS